MQSYLSKLVSFMLSLLSVSIDICFSVFLTPAEILFAFVLSAFIIGSDRMTVLSGNSLSNLFFTVYELVDNSAGIRIYSIIRSGV